MVLSSQAGSWWRPASGAPARTFGFGSTRSSSSWLWRITRADYDRKARELKEQQAEIAVQIEQHQAGDGTFRTTLESLISLASRAADIFEGSKTDEKRQLLAFVFSNLKLRGKSLEFSMRSPFDLMVDRADYPDWLGDLDSNQD